MIEFVNFALVLLMAIPAIAVLYMIFTVISIAIKGEN
jgi:hypothetical protein